MKVYLFKPTTSYKVVGSKRTFGVEIETAKSFGYRNIRSSFSAKPDGSISGLEFVSQPMKSDQGLKEIEVFCHQALENHMKIDWSCGLHVHINATPETPESRCRVFEAYLRTHEMWHSLIPVARRNTLHCRSWKDSTNQLVCEAAAILEQIDLGDTNGFNAITRYLFSYDNSLSGREPRYWWLNMSAVKKHGTYEMRCHQGSLNPYKICGWALAHSQFIDKVSGMTRQELHDALPEDISPADMLTEVGRGIWTEPRLKDFWAKRQKAIDDGHGLRPDDDSPGMFVDESWVA
jgi:hypothetical protein